jgi:hypothetical protein
MRIGYVTPGLNSPAREPPSLISSVMTAWAQWLQLIQLPGTFSWS